MINSFRDKYYFLSNFSPSIIKYNGYKYPTMEHYYQAMKSEDERFWNKILKLKYPGQAKKAGRYVILRENWDELKINIMKTGLKIKFNIPELKNNLLNTENNFLIEGNYWHDNYWGNCYCNKCKNKKGLNILGLLIMKIREEINYVL